MGIQYYRNVKACNEIFMVSNSGCSKIMKLEYPIFNKYHLTFPLSYTEADIISEIVTINRFLNKEKFASYTGLIPGEYSSGGIYNIACPFHIGILFK